MNNDQQIMENLLLTTKGVCDLYLHGAIESATPDVHQAFDGALGESLDMQSDIYAEMSSRGWYQNQQADTQQIAQVRQKFLMNCFFTQAGCSRPSHRRSLQNVKVLLTPAVLRNFRYVKKRRCQAQPELA